MAKTVLGDEDLEGITELEKFDPDRVDGVLAPASGLPFLVIKAAQGGDMDADRKDDSMDGGDDGTRMVAGSDIDGSGVGDEDAKKEAAGAADATAAAEDAAPSGDSEESATKEAAAELDPDGTLAVRNASPADREAYLAALKEHRGGEPLGKGAATGTEYLAAQAAWRKWSAHGEAEGLDGTQAGAAVWLAKHGTGPVPAPEAAPEAVPVDEPVVIGEAAEALLAEIVKAEATVYKRNVDTAERKRLASEGKALPDGSYPIANAGDLDNAAHLARSGHGNVSGAKALIRRRAAELGVSNPLDDGNETKKDAAGTPETPEAGSAPVDAAPVAETAEKADGDDAPKGKKCPACKGSGKIRGGNVTCPKCKGKGVLPPKAAKVAAAAADAVKATLAAGLISQQAADDLIAQIEAEAAKAAGPGARPLPAEVLPVPAHREPDGSSTVEQLEPDAGLGTEPDSTMDHVPASVAALAMKEASYEVRRMHDAICAAFAADDVLAAYPALKSVADAVDAGLFTKEAQDALGEGEPARAAVAAQLAATAMAFKGFSPAAIADGHAFLHKSFADMYPNEHISPQMGIKPGSYQRPYLSAGHAAQNSGGWTVNVPPSTHTPEPQDYQRGYLTAGHAAMSPADHGPNNPNPPDAGGHAYYSTTEKDMAAAAMRSMHDHIQATYDGCCPMAPARTVLPPGMGATNTPSTEMPHATGGVPGMNKEAGMEMGGSPAPGGNRKIKGNKGSGGKKKIAKMLEAALRNSQVNLLGPAEVEAIIASKLAPLVEAHNSQVTKMQQQLDELGSQPDPAMAPVRGQMARAGTGTAQPVAKRSLVDEAHESRVAAAAQDQRDLYEYVTKQAASPDPNMRERAQALLDQMAGEHVPA